MSIIQYLPKLTVHINVFGILQVLAKVLEIEVTCCEFLIWQYPNVIIKDIIALIKCSISTKLQITYICTIFRFIRNMKAFILSPILWVILLVPSALSEKREESASKNEVPSMKEAPAIPAINHQDIDNSFENGTINPWTDCSEDGTRWAIESNFSWTNGNGRSQMQVAPQPPPLNHGKYFILLKNDWTIFGIGILSSPYFVAYPGDEIMFSYWLHSTYFSNIEV